MIERRYIPGYGNMEIWFERVKSEYVYRVFCESDIEIHDEHAEPIYESYYYDGCNAFLNELSDY